MRYTPKGTSVTIGLHDLDGFVFAYVDDEGPGLPPGQRARSTFRAFFQRQDKRRESRPRALFLQDHRRALGRRNRRGNSRGRAARDSGSDLPRAAKQPRSAKPEAGRKIRGKRKISQIRKAEKSLRILVADDAELNRDLVIELLEKRGHVAEAVADGRQALAALEKNTFDVVLMDEEMPAHERTANHPLRFAGKRSERENTRSSSASPATPRKKTKSVSAKQEWTHISPNRSNGQAV